jgi:hypothetical protein
VSLPARPPWRPVRRAAELRQAIGQPGQHLHLRFRGVQAEDVAAIIRQQEDRKGD